MTLDPNDQAQNTTFTNAQGQDVNFSASPPANASPTTQTDEDILTKDILELMGASNLPDDKKQELYQKMMATIQNRVIARVTDEIAEADMPTWLQIVDTGDKTQIEQFLKDRNIDLPKLMLEEAIIYKTEMVDLAKQAK